MFLFLGPFPPPVSGQTLADEGLCEVLAEHGVVQKLQTQRLDGSSSLLNNVVKIARHARLTLKLRSTSEPVLFISVERGRGKMLQQLLLKLAGRRFTAIVFVYHIWDGVDLGKNFRELALRRADRVLHLALCDCHADKIRKVVTRPDRETVLEMSNSAWMSITTPVPAVSEQSLGRIGMISNLTREKGADTFVRIAGSGEIGINAPEFVLAGPLRDETLSPEIDAAVASGALSYLGQIPSEERYQFMSELSLLVFPTRYRSETEPLIVLEALRLGIPVLASSVGCLAERLPECWLLPIDASDGCWTAAIRKIVENPEENAALARASWQKIGDQASRELDTVLEWLEDSK